MKFVATAISAVCLLVNIYGYSQEFFSEKKISRQKIFIQAQHQPTDEIVSLRQRDNVTQLPINITGRVTDEEGNPIARVSVLVKGTKTGTITNDNGIFSIEAGIGNVLEFSSISYVAKEIKIASSTVNIRLYLQIKPLEQLVVSGNYVANKRRADVSSVTVLTGKELEAMPGFNLTNVLEGVVPGVTFSSLGTTLFRVGEYYNSQIQVRGAAKITGLGDASAVKTYIDGVVYAAGTDYLAMINRDDIERIEIVRGPAAATLYGSGASGGVMLIYTKKGKPDHTSIRATTSAGFQKSDYTEKENQFQQKHSAEFYQGVKSFSYVIGGSYRTQNDYLPHGSVKNQAAYANFNYSTGKFKFSLSNNYNVNDIVDSRNPVFDTISGAGIFLYTYKDSAYYKTTARIQSGAVSFNTTFQPTSWWTHNLVLGYSKNNFRRFPDFAVFTDTTLIKYYMRNGGGVGAQNWNRKDETPTISYNNRIKIGGADDPFKMDIVSGFEYSNTLRDDFIYNTQILYTTAGGYRYTANRVGSTPFFHYNRKFTGVFLQIAPSLKDKYFLVAGFRYEKSNVSIAVINPKIGFTTNFELAHFILKPRINWGRGITPPPYFITHPQPGFGGVVFIANPDIKPQEQSGIDAAIEVYDKKGNYKVEIIRYTNVVINGFAQKANFTVTPGTVTYSNIGKFANKGWEFVCEYKINKFKVTGNYSIINATYVDSFIGRKTFYNGDRVDGVPNYAAGASFNYNFPKLFGKSDRLSATLSMTSSGKMITLDNYNYTIAFARWRAGNGSNPNSNSSIYYRETPGVTKYNLNMDYQMHPNLRFFVQAQNFTNNIKTDWDKSFPLPGASWMFGLNFNLNNTTK